MKILDKVLEMSVPVMTLAEAIKQVAISVGTLTQSIAMLAHNQEVHHQMIMQLAAVVTKMNGKSADVGSMPSVNSVKDNKPN